MPHKPRNSAFAEEIKLSFAKQTIMGLIGAELSRVEPGVVEITLPYRADLTQQHGYMHAGAITAIVDSACGYAALSLIPAGVEVLTVEYKVNFLAPASGSRFVARGRVTKPGRTLTVCTGDVVVRDDDGRERHVATMLATIMAVPPRVEGQPSSSAF